MNGIDGPKGPNKYNQRNLLPRDERLALEIMDRLEQNFQSMGMRIPKPDILKLLMNIYGNASTAHANGERLYKSRPGSDLYTPIDMDNYLRHLYQKAVSQKQKPMINLDGFLTRKIKTHLDDYLIGQTAAKKTLAVAFYEHLKRIKYQGPVKIKKKNLLIIGPTGSGKTYSIEVLAEHFKVPMIIFNCTTLTASGYTGQSMEDVLKELYQKANDDIEQTQKGIVYLDEIDKIRATSSANGLDVGGKGAQQVLLKLIDGGDVSVPLDRSGQQVVKINTDNILFICGGSFKGDSTSGAPSLEQVVRERIDEKYRTNSIGFKSQEQEKVQEMLDQQDMLKFLQDVDVYNFGMLNELVGRIKNTVVFNRLSIDELERIITEPMNSILEQNKELLGMDNADVHITPAAKRLMAELAYRLDTGARSLDKVMEEVLAPLKFDISGNKNPYKHVIRKKDIEKLERFKL